MTFGHLVPVWSHVYYDMMHCKTAPDRWFTIYYCRNISTVGQKVKELQGSVPSDGGYRRQCYIPE